MRKKKWLAAGILLAWALPFTFPSLAAATDSNSQEIQVPFPEFPGRATGEIYARIYKEPRPTKIYEEAVTTPQTRETKQEETTEEAKAGGDESLPAEESSPTEEPAARPRYQSGMNEITYIGGTAYQNGEKVYRIDEESGQVTIYPYAFIMALEEERDFVIQLKDTEGTVWYRIRYAQEDIQSADLSRIKEVTFDFKQICGHLRAADKLIESAKDGGVRLLFCEQKNYGIPVYLGIRAPENWNRSYGVYLYVCDKSRGEFALSQESLSIDDDWLVEVRMETMEDVVFTQNRATPFELHTWVEGVVKGNRQVDKKSAVMGAVLTVLGGCGAIGFCGFLTGRIGTKSSAGR